MQKMKKVESAESTQLITSDTLFDGELYCRQFKNGYRFSVDAILIAQFYRPSKGETILDLGAGSGVIGLIMMYRWKQFIASLRALELQPELCELCNQNYRENGVDDTCCCHQGDVSQILQIFRPESFSLIVCNPPFYRPESGRKSLARQAKIARHQITADIAGFAKGAAAVLKNGGSAVFIYPAEQLVELIAALSGVNLEIKELQFVYSYPNAQVNAKLVLVRCTKNGGRGLWVKEPLYIYQEKNGDYSEQMKQFFTC